MTQFVFDKYNYFMVDDDRIFMWDAPNVVEIVGVVAQDFLKYGSMCGCGLPPGVYDTFIRYRHDLKRNG